MNSLVAKKDNHSKGPKDSVQTKLRVNEPGDQFEQEADAMADRVMGMQGTENETTGIPESRENFLSFTPSHSAPEVMRKETSGEGGNAPSGMHDTLNRSNGSPLPDSTRNFMEGAFSADFSGVKVHADSDASSMNKKIHARAFTHGNDIYFNAGQYEPDSNKGRRLLSHELTHVVQQRSGDSDSNQIFRKSDPDSTNLISTGNDEGDKFPSSFIIDWSEPFQISFGARTSDYGDVIFQVLFKYLGTQEPKRFQDKNHLWETDPIFSWKFREPNSKRINAKLINYSNTSFAIDVYNDSSVILEFVHELQPPERSGARNHKINPYRNGEEFGFFTMQFSTAPIKAISEATGTISAVTQQPLNTTASGLEDFGLPTSTLIKMAQERLTSLPGYTFSFIVLQSRLAKDLQNPDVDIDLDLNQRALKLLEVLNSLGGTFLTMDELMKPDQYLGDLANTAVDEIKRIKDIYLFAIAAAYNFSNYDDTQALFGVNTVRNQSTVTISSDEYLSQANLAFSRFPGWLNKLYLQDANGVTKLLLELPKAEQELHDWKKANNDEYSHKYRITEDMIHSGWNSSSFRYFLDERSKIEIELRKETKDVNERIHQLYYNVQVATGILNAMILAEQSQYLAHQLSSSYINSALEVPFANLADMAWKDSSALTRIILELEQCSYEGGEDRKTKINSALNKLKNLGPDLEEHFDRYQNRLKWVNRIDVVGKMALIIAAAALTGGIAGSLAAGSLEGAGAFTIFAGEAIASGFAFTTVSRFGQQAFFGKAEGSFLGDWFWNTLTFGLLKGVTTKYSKIFELTKDASRISKIGFSLGKTATAMISLHGFGEIQHLITTHKLMTSDEREEAVFQNLVLTVALSAGHFITEPIEKRITKGIADKIGLDKLLKDRLQAISAERSSVKEKLDALLNGEGNPKDIESLLNESEKLWGKELKLLQDSASRGLLDKNELTTSIKAYQNHIADLQLKLSKIGVNTSGTGGATFKPFGPGTVTFTPSGRALIEKAYTPDPSDPSTAGRSLTKSKTIPGALEGRLPTGELTYFIPVEEQVFKSGSSPKTAKEITAFLDKTDFKVGEKKGLIGYDKQVFNKRSAGRVGLLAEHFTLEDLRVLGKYLYDNKISLTDELVGILMDTVPPGLMKEAILKIKIAGLMETQTDVRIDLDEEQGIQVIDPLTKKQKAIKTQNESSVEQPWRSAELQLIRPLVELFGPAGWLVSERFYPPDAATGELLGSTVPEYYNTILHKAFEVKRLNLEELGVGKRGQRIGKPSKRSFEALNRARTQLAGRRWLIQGAEQNIVFNVTGQGVEDVTAVGVQIKELLKINHINYDRLYIQNGNTLTEINLGAE